jgi:hypothetical protein
MKYHVFRILFIIIIATMSGCTSPGRYTVVILDGEKKPVVTCVFTGKDENNDGIIDIAELTSFEESGPNVYSSAIGPDKGWQNDVNIKDIPPIIHTLKDIVKFRFSIKDIGKRNPILEYNTNTKDMVKVGKFYFWRSVEISNNGTKFGIFSGVSDGMQGVEMSMRSTDDYAMKVEKR